MIVKFLQYNYELKQEIREIRRVLPNLFLQKKHSFIDVLSISPNITVWMSKISIYQIFYLGYSVNFAIAYLPQISF